MAPSPTSSDSLLHDRYKGLLPKGKNIVSLAVELTGHRLDKILRGSSERKEILGQTVDLGRELGNWRTSMISVQGRGSGNVLGKLLCW